MRRSFREAAPKIHPTAFIHDSAEVIGRVKIHEKASIWPKAVLRGDIEPVVIGPESNVQDACIAHTSEKLPVVLGRGVTVGHGAILHGTRVGDYSLIGMGAILLDGSVIGRECLVAAGAVVPERMRVPARSLVAGVPARVRRKLSAKEVAAFHRRAQEYVRYAKDHRETSFPL